MMVIFTVLSKSHFMKEVIVNVRMQVFPSNVMNSCWSPLHVKLLLLLYYLLVTIGKQILLSVNLSVTVTHAPP